MGRPPRAEQAAEELRAVIGTLVRRLRTEVEPENEVTWPQRSVLRRLDADGPATTADLARAEKIRPQTMGAFVAELEELGMVVRTDDATDGRRRLVGITAAGRRALETGRAARQSWLAEAIAAQLDAEEQRALLAALELVRRIAESG